MKTQRIKTLSALTIVLLMITASNLHAQRGRFYTKERNFNNKGICEIIPDLTEEQEAKIKELRVDHLKEMKPFRNQVNELRARKQTLMTSDNANLKEINSVIDKMTDIQSKMMKATAKHHQEVRNLLTDEQKLFLDSRRMRGSTYGKGMRNAGRRMCGEGFGMYNYYTEETSN